jgi:hypothetical protein
MQRSWRTGFDVNPKVVGWAPVLGLVVGAIGVAVNIREANGDMRVGILPWTMVLAIVCLAACCLGVLSFHGPTPGWWTIIGSWWATLALLGIASFFLAIALGTSLGIEEEEAGLLALPPLLGIMFGVATMTPALLTLAFGVTKERQLRWYGIVAVWVAAPVLPVMLVSGGIAEGTAETASLSTLMTLYVGAWIVLGISLIRGNAPTPEI